MDREEADAVRSRLSRFLADQAKARKQSVSRADERTA